MIKIYGMRSCPDCEYVERQASGNPDYQIVDLGDHVKNLKAFMMLRDSESVFEEAKRKGSIGIPCFVLEDGSVTLTPEEAGLKSRPTEEVAEGASCNIDGSGC